MHFCMGARAFVGGCERVCGHVCVPSLGGNPGKHPARPNSASRLAERPCEHEHAHPFLHGSPLPIHPAPTDEHMHTPNISAHAHTPTHASTHQRARGRTPPPLPPLRPPKAKPPAPPSPSPNTPTSDKPPWKTLQGTYRQPQLLLQVPSLRGDPSGLPARIKHCKGVLGVGKAHKGLAVR